MKQKYEEPAIAFAGDAMELVQLDGPGKTPRQSDKTPPTIDVGYVMGYYVSDLDE